VIEGEGAENDNEVRWQVNRASDQARRRLEPSALEPGCHEGIPLDRIARSDDGELHRQRHGPGIRDS
jgi:hypothetical protein